MRDDGLEKRLKGRTIDELKEELICRLVPEKGVPWIHVH